MRGKFKKFVVYLLAIAIVTPLWLVSGLLNAKPAMASTSKELFKDDVYVHTLDATTGWDERGQELFTWGSKPNAYIEARALKAEVDPAGIYRIEAQWNTWDDHTQNAKYEIVQSDNGRIIDSVNQQRLASGSTAPNGTMSGYYTLASNYHYFGDFDLKVKLFGESSDNGNVSFISFRITYLRDNAIPSAPLLISPSENAYINDQTPLFTWDNSLDNDGDQIKYHLLVYKKGDAVAKIDQDLISATSYQTTLPEKLSDGYYDWNVTANDGQNLVLSARNDFVILTEEPDIPANLTASVDGPNVNLSWDLTKDALGDNVAGYNIYRSSSPEQKINFVAGTNYTDTPLENGTFNYRITSVDKAGNESDKSNIINVLVDYTKAPDVTAVPGDGKSIDISFDGVGGGVSEYDIYINGVLSRTQSVVGNDLGVHYSYNISVADYGIYVVIVRVLFGGIYAESQSKQVDISAPYSAPTQVAVISGETLSITPETAEAAESTVEEPATAEKPEEEGQIKGEEETEEENGTEKINWTPWIILFILIVLAGAATGGYFYWFAGDEEVQTVVKPKPEISKKPIATTKTKGSAKKPRRW